MLDKTKNYKIDVSALNGAERIALQKELFSKGYKWFAGGTYTYTDKEEFYLLHEDMDITCCNREYARKIDHTAITVSDIMPQSEDRTLRDWFAGLALNGMLPSDNEPLEIIARDAYRYADAMLKERNK